MKHAAILTAEKILNTTQIVDLAGVTGDVLTNFPIPIASILSEIIMLQCEKLDKKVFNEIKSKRLINELKGLIK